MAEIITKTVVELEKLGLYNELIKQYIDTADAKKWESATFNEETRVVSFYTVPQPSGDVEPVFTFTLPEVDFSEVYNAIEAVEKKADKNAEDISAINNAETGILAQAKAHADGKDEAIAAAKKAGDDAQADVDALEETVSGMYTNEQIDTKIADAKTEAIENATYNDTQVKADIAANAKSIEDEVARADAAEKANKALIDGLDTRMGEAETAIAGVDTKIAEAVAASQHLKKEIVDTIPAVEDAKEDIIYMVAIEGGEGVQKYEEYLLINGEMEKIGDTSVDLTGYAKETYVDQAEADAIATAKAYTDEKDTAMNTRVETVETAIGENGSVTNAIAEAKQAGEDASVAVTALEEGQVAINTQAIADNKTAVEAAQADATSALEQITAIQYATEDDIRGLFE